MSLIYEKPLKIEIFGNTLIVNGKEHPCSVRKLSEMKNVLMSETKEDGDIDMYYMFRNIYVKNGMRYDITFIPARIAGGEFAKTYGHCHPVARDHLRYPEVYQVLSGKALFILQKELETTGTEVLVVSAKKGDVVLIPPNYCHASINPSEKDLLLANVVAVDFKSLYEMYKRKKGAAYYYTKQGLVPNKNYRIEKTEKPSPKEINKRYGFSSKDLLKEFHKDPEKFEFLKKPELLKL